MTTRQGRNWIGNEMIFVGNGFILPNGFVENKGMEIFEVNVI